MKDTKAYLNQIRNINLKIKSLTFEKDEIGRTLPTSWNTEERVTSTKIIHDQIAQKIVDIDARIEKEIKSKIELQETIRKQIDGLQNAQYSLILRLRYINGYGFNRIAHEMRYSRRQIMNIYQDALEDFRNKYF